MSHQTEAALPPLYRHNIQPIRTLVWLNCHNYVKKQRKTYMVEKPSHVKKTIPKRSV
jgi:hypothetical protein